MSLGNSLVKIVASERIAGAMLRANEGAVCGMSGSKVQQALGRTSLAVALQLAAAGTAIENSIIAGEVARNG